jgi:hypothetical protein
MTNLNLFFSRVPGLVASIALLAVAMNMPASAQDTHIQRYGEKDKEKTATEKAAEKEAERAYQRSLGNIPAQKSTDPWGNGAQRRCAAKGHQDRVAEAEGQDRR